MTRQTHSWGAYTNNNDGTHSRRCGICNYNSTASHSRGSGCRCACGYQYSHSYGSYVSNGASGHSRSCTYCGTSSSSSHSFGPWQDNGTNERRSCNSCGYSETRAHGSGTCPGCTASPSPDGGGDTGGGTPPSADPNCSHSSVSSNYSYDGNQHWKTCNNCNGQVNVSSHNNETQSNGTSKCKVCGRTSGIPSTPTPAPGCVHSNYGTKIIGESATQHTIGCSGCGTALKVENHYGWSYSHTNNGITYEKCSGCSYARTAGSVTPCPQRGKEHSWTTYTGWSYYSATHHVQTRRCNECNSTDANYATHSTPPCVCNWQG